MSESTATPVQPTQPQHPFLSNSVYDKLKQGAQVVLPALAALYLTLGALWNLPEPEKVAASIAAVNVFLGVLVNLAARKYETSGLKYDGYVTVNDNVEDESRDLKFSTTTDPYVAAAQKEIIYKVVNPAPKP